MPKMPLPPAESMNLDSLAEVARGGMGSVELARVLDGRLTGQILAVKRLHANIAEDPEFVSMFLDEAWVTAALKNPNVAQVVAWGNDEKGMFLAIELVQGVSLSRLIKEAQQNQEAFAERTVAFICSQMCAGLVAAHTLTTPDGSPLGIVHRDLTPANVLISFEGVVKIIDFGIAQAEERISHTRTGQLKGKPAYMAPEQQRGGGVDARADLFAFGVVMFEMLAGRRPWTSKGAFDVMMEISNDPHPDLGELRKGLNPEFVAIAHQCLEKKAEDRPRSAAEIKARLDGWLSAKGFSSDDQHSLAQFVLRNSQPQVLWWQEALRGEHAKKKAPTFKELEEKIDEERERKAKAARRATAPPARRPAAGIGTQPMQAFQPGGQAGGQPGGGPDSGGVPSSGPVSSQQPLPPSSGNAGRSPMMGVPPSPLAAAGPPASFGSGGSGQYPAAGPASFRPSGSGQYSAVAPPPNLAQSSATPKPFAGAGTEFMAISPFASGVPLPPSQPQPQVGHSSGSFPASQRQGLPPPHAPVQPTLQDASYEGATLPMSPGLATANMTQPLPPNAMALLGMQDGRITGTNLGPPSSSPGSAPPIPAPASPKKRGFGVILGVVVVLLLGGIAAGLWFFGDRIGVNLRGDDAAERARGAGKTK
jgi:serine/threonine protein kinase